MKLIIVRHGETVENVKNLSQGHIDGTLTDNGQNQVRKLGERLKDAKIDFIYCSDLGRTKDTLKEIIRFHPHIPVIYNDLLRERSKGIFEGKPKEVLTKVRERAGGTRFEYRPEGGENFPDVRARVKAFIDFLFLRHADSETILLCTHGGWKNSFMSYLLNMPFEETVQRFNFKNASVTTLNLKRDGKYLLHLVNCTKHLDGEVGVETCE